jgi:hypothetical protein
MKKKKILKSTVPVPYIFATFSCLPLDPEPGSRFRIRIHKATGIESRFNPDQDKYPQPCLKLTIAYRYQCCKVPEQTRYRT